MKTKQVSGYYIPLQNTINDLFIIAFLYLISFIITNPLRDFPLNDDWSYGLAVKYMIENGDFRPNGWPAMTLIIHTLWGSLFAIINGFSYKTLHISTLIMSYIAVFSTYFLIRELNQTRLINFFATLLFAFSPIYFVLSHTFMTDIPFPALSIIASIFFVGYLKYNSIFD